MQNKNKELSLEIKSNIRELHSAHQINHRQKQKFPGMAMTGPLIELIELRRLSITNDESAEYTRQDLADFLFKNVTLKDGTDGYIEMFKVLVKIPAAKKYKTQITKFIKWLEYLGNSDKLMEVLVDMDLIELAEKDKKVLMYLIDKYENLKSNQ